MEEEEGEERESCRRIISKGEEKEKNLTEDRRASCDDPA